jgi:hypothetical protein
MNIISRALSSSLNRLIADRISFTDRVFFCFSVVFIIFKSKNWSKKKKAKTCAAITVGVNRVIEEEEEEGGKCYLHIARISHSGTPTIRPLLYRRERKRKWLIHRCRRCLIATLSRKRKRPNNNKKRAKQAHSSARYIYRNQWIGKNVGRHKTFCF